MQIVDIDKNYFRRGNLCFLQVYSLLQSFGKTLDNKVFIGIIIQILNFFEDSLIDLLVVYEEALLDLVLAGWRKLVRNTSNELARVEGLEF